jgi:hypothetical protein
MRCFAKEVKTLNGEPMAVPHAAAPPAGSLGPKELRAAYKLPSSGGQGRLVAIVDAFDAPNAEADMNVYRQYYGIPPCTTANGCFRKLNQDGQPGPYPPGDRGWEGEIMVDLDMVSATCPDCTIVLIEARSQNGVDLGPCVAKAHELGAISVNNSYGGPESDPDSVASFNFYTQPGMLVVASSGDDGYLKTVNDQMAIVPEVAFPAASPAVLSVGGTSLRPSTSTRGWAETAWSGAGSGCSKSQAKPPWQKDPGCMKRFVADISAVGDPATGVAMYDRGSWIAIGGTSVSAPIIAGIAGLFNITEPSWPYSNTDKFFDVTSGTNDPPAPGRCGTYQCIAGPGVDGPTGIGTPNATAWTAQPPRDGGSPSGTGGAGGAGAGGRGAGGAGGSSPSGAGGSVSPVGVGGQGGAGPGAGGAATGTGTGTGAGGSTETTGTQTTGAGGGASTTTNGSTSTGSNPFAPKADQGGGCSCRIVGGPKAAPSYTTSESESRSSGAAWASLGILAAAVRIGSRRRSRRY